MMKMIASKRNPRVSNTMVLLQLLSCLLLLLCQHKILPVHPFASRRIAYRKNHHRRRIVQDVRSRDKPTLLHAQIDPENDQTENSSSNGNGGSKEQQQPPQKDDIGDTVEEFMAMEEASRRVNSRLMMPYRILSSVGRTFQFFAYGFLIFCFVLQLAGYALINDGSGSIRIGTLDEKAFQLETMKTVKTAATTTTTTTNNNK